MNAFILKIKYSSHNKKNDHENYRLDDGVIGLGSRDYKIYYVQQRIVPLRFPQNGIRHFTGEYLISGCIGYYVIIEREFSSNGNLTKAVFENFETGDVKTIEFH